MHNHFCKACPCITTAASNMINVSAPPGDPDEWEQNIQINLTGPMRLTRRLTPAMAEKGEGYHINISSSAGKHPSPKQCAYSAAKWGMTGFALSSAKVRSES